MKVMDRRMIFLIILVLISIWEKDVSCQHQLSPSRSSPEIISFTGPDTLKVKKGASFTCEARGSPSPSVVWTINGRPVVKVMSYRVSTRASGNTISSKITLKAHQAADRAALKCTAKNEVSSESSTRTIKIIGIPVKVIKVTGPDDLDTFNDGNYTCEGIGIPPPNVTWTFNGKPLMKFFKKYRISNRYFSGKYTSKLNVLANKGSERAPLKCTLNNPLGSDSKSRMVKITGVSKVTTTTETAVTIHSMSGTDHLVTLKDGKYTCVGIGTPPPNVTWTFNGKPLNKFFMKFRISNRYSSGKYISTLNVVANRNSKRAALTCTLDNHLGSDSQSRMIKVTGASKHSSTTETIVKIHSMSGPAMLKLLQDGTYTCKASGFPVPTVKWTFNGEALTDYFTSYRVRSSFGGSKFASTLVVNAREPSKKGALKCTITNKFGSISKTRMVQIGRICKAVADIGFILDSSGSLKEHYDEEKYFLKSLASSLGISLQIHRGSVITFSERARLSIKFGKFNETSKFNKAVDDIPLMGYRTRIDLALRLSQKAMFNVKNGARPNISRILILLTDGSQTKVANSEDPATVADEIRKSGIHMVVVGIGKKIKKLELYSIAGSMHNTFTADSFKELIQGKLTRKITSTVCETSN